MAAGFACALVLSACAFALSACTGAIGNSEQDSSAQSPTAGSAGQAHAGPGQAGDSGGAGASGNAGASGAGSGADACAVPDTGASVLRRLGREEYQRTLQALFALPQPPAVDAVPADAQQGGFRTVAAIQSLSDQHLLAYLEVAEQLGGELMLDAPRRQQVLGCEIEAADCLSGFIERFGRLAFRRELTSEEASSLHGAAMSSARDASDAYRFAIEGMLTSPNFLFRVEVGDNAQLAELAPHELASRLSFLLSGRGPSAALLDRAEAGELSTADGIASVAAELLTAEHARDVTRSFFRQWLHFETLRAPNVAPPGFTPALMPDMIAETDRLLEDFAWQPGVRFTDVLSANYTYLTPALGSFYDLSVLGPGLSRVELPSEHPRAGTGLLTHASIISAKTDADLISFRGAFLREAFLCQKLSIPPDLQAQIEDSVAGLSYPEVIALRNRDQPCAGCHAQIDPIGVAFSAYDAIGHFDPSVDVSEHGLPTRFEGLQPPDFSTLSQLAATLAAEPAVAACIAKKLFTFAHGREPGPADACVLAAARERFAQTDGQLPSLLAAFVESPAFRLRRAP